MEKKNPLLEPKAKVRRGVQARLACFKLIAFLDLYRYFGLADWRKEEILAQNPRASALRVAVRFQPQAVAFLPIWGMTGTL